VVLPERIELSTSPLPRECSTTELRQQTRRNPVFIAFRWTIREGEIHDRVKAGKAPSASGGTLDRERDSLYPDILSAKRLRRYLSRQMPIA
jgi:hypothetical protein